MFELGFRAGVAAILHDEFDIVRRGRGQGHDDRGAHGHAVQDDGALVAKVLDDPMDPVQGVFGFLQTECDGVAVAGAVGLVVEQDHIEALFQIKRYEGAKLVEAVGPVAVGAKDIALAWNGGREQRGMQVPAARAATVERLLVEIFERFEFLFFELLDAFEVGIGHLLVFER